jgi:hypothetical protein
MAEILSGAVDVTYNDSLVTGEGVTWSTVSVGDVFIVSADNVWYVIASISPPTSNVSGKWELHLNIPYQGVTASGVAYAICVDYSPLYNFLIVNPGDIRTDLIQRRNIAILESILSSLSASGGSGVVKIDVPITGVLIGANTIPVSFSSTLPHLPAHIFRPTMEKSNPNDDNIDAVTIDSVTTSGFNVNLSGAAVSGHKLRCAYIL